jgi:hypothetical protein
MAVAVADEARKPTGVIEMSMREHRIVDGLGIDRERLPVALFQLVRTLEQPAIDKQAPAGGLDQIL